ncbi:MAG TPA: hypothetical protein VF250_02765 [Conexibacter sp.]
MDPAHETDELARRIARWLAPYVAEELRRARLDEAAPVASYDDAACERYLMGLGTGVLERADRFFGALARDGEIGSLELARLLGLSSPRYLAANLTNSLKQRADALALPRPWREGVDADDRTRWSDRDGIAARMVAAIAVERQWRSDLPRTQRITAADVAAGRIRVPARGKPLFPARAAQIEVELLGRRIAGRWNPRVDQDKSGVVSIGRAPLRALADGGELQLDDRLLIEQRDGVFVLFGAAQR